LNNQKLLYYMMIFSCIAFVYTATQGGFIGLNYMPITIPALVGISNIALLVTFIMGMKVMVTKLKVVGLIYCLASFGMSYVLFSPNLPSQFLFFGNSSSSFVLLYPIGLLMIGTFYQTYFWIAIRAQSTLNAAVILLGLSVVLIGSGFLGLRGSIAETVMIGFPGLIVSIIAYFMARSRIAARKAKEQ